MLRNTNARWPVGTLVTSISTASSSLSSLPCTPCDGFCPQIPPIPPDKGYVKYAVLDGMGTLDHGNKRQAIRQSRESKQDFLTIARCIMSLRTNMLNMLIISAARPQFGCVSVRTATANYHGRQLGELIVTVVDRGFSHGVNSSFAAPSIGRVGGGCR